MNGICKDIFKAIHEGKWLAIEYRNKGGSTTKYWIGIKDINVQKRMLFVDGLHLKELTCKELNIYIDSIISTNLIEGTYQPVNSKLIGDIRDNPERYSEIFSNTANMKILNYLADCNKLDCTPYKTDYKLISKLDLDRIPPEGYRLSDEQFKIIVDHFQFKTDREKQNDQTWFVQLAMNMLSIYTKEGLYLLAYKKLQFDVRSRMLVADDEVTVCKEFTVDGTNKVSIRRFLDADDLYLLNEFEAYQEKIKDRITEQGGGRLKVDDMPYVLAVGMNYNVDLNKEYASIVKMYEEGNVTTPIKAFFGDITVPSRRRKDYPIALLNRRVNLDQLLAIHNAVKYPVAYIQGPPGTGKTNTIINTITTAFFNEKTVLFSSYNNHPIDSVFHALSSIKYLGVSLRSFRAEKLSAFVHALLSFDETASEIYKDIKDNYPIVLTRDMEKARRWLHEKVRGTERTGILVTKESARFKPLAIHILPSGDENAVHWFLEDKDDTRSSNYLEDAATEIQVQGLELDYTCLLWDADMRYEDGKWKFYRFNGQTKWVEQQGKSESNQELLKYMLNAYRVLLTRARMGMVICVPEGNPNKTPTGFWEDSTRLPEYYDGTYQYLKGIGIKEI